MTDTQPTRRWLVPFVTIIAGQALSSIGSRLAGFALVWWLASTTHSATVLALGTLCEILPNVVLGPFMGALVDRWNRRRVMIVADAAVALLSLGLAFVSWSGHLAIWHVYVILFARAIGGTFHWTAMSASTPLMVPREHLSRVAGLNQSLNGVLSVVAPPLGALFYSLLPIYGIMGIDVATALVAIVPLMFVQIPQPRSGATNALTLRSLGADVRAGLRYVWGWPGLRAVMIMAALVNLLLTPAMSLLPLVVEQHFGLGASALGWLESSWGLGVVVGGLALGVWGGFKRRVLTSMLGLMGIGLGTVILGLAPARWFALAVAGLGVAGISNPITNGPLMAVMQSTVPPEMLGRVNAMLHSLSSAMMPLGMAVAGPLSDAMGVRFWFVMGGVVCLGMGLAGLFMPAVVHLEDGRAAELEPSPAALT